MNRIGEINKTKSGDLAIISDYRTKEDIDVILKSNNIVIKTTYEQFLLGNIGTDGHRINWIGEEVCDGDGEPCHIVEHDSDDNVTVQYRDGDIIAGLKLDDVIVSNFARNDITFTKTGRGIARERKRTYENVSYMLEKYRYCVMIRPCGFGKTKIGLKLFKSEKYNKCLFLHPTGDDMNAEIVNKSHLRKKTDTRTYAWLCRQSQETIKKLKYDLVFLDEVHCIGGDEDGTGAYKTYCAVKTLMETHPMTHFLGATATPIRMDGINVIAKMFRNHCCYPYTEEDAFEDGILKKPYYFYSIYDVVAKVRDKIRKETTVNIDMNREKLQQTFKFSEDDINELDTQFMDIHIRETCNKILPDTSYMRFIAFYLTNDEIAKNKEKVLEWFKKAYPEHQIEHIIVTNRTKKSLKDVDALPTMPTKPGYKGRIDIIFNCEKLCMGYHSELITGLILDRKTKSISKYIQMIGRLLTCDNDDPVIIFDIVDNLHSDFVYTPFMPIDAEDVAPRFEISEAKTFENVMAAHPYARRWDVIEENNEKARKAEKILKKLNGTENQKANSKKTSAKEQVINKIENTVALNNNADIAELQTKENNGKKLPNNNFQIHDEIQEARNIAAQRNISFKEAANYMAGIEGEYDIPHFEKNEPVLSQESYETNSSNIHQPVSQINNTEKYKEEKQELGYMPGGYYYDFNTGNLYSKNVKMLNRSADFEEEIGKIIKSITKATIENIITKWHTYPSCDRDYNEYSEIDKKSSKYKLLKNCSEFIYSIPVEKTILYMIEKKIS